MSYYLWHSLAAMAMLRRHHPQIPTIIITQLYCSVLPDSPQTGCETNVDWPYSPIESSSWQSISSQPFPPLPDCPPPPPDWLLNCALTVIYSPIESSSCSSSLSPQPILPTSGSFPHPQLFLIESLSNVTAASSSAEVDVSDCWIDVLSPPSSPACVVVVYRYRRRRHDKGIAAEIRFRWLC